MIWLEFTRNNALKGMVDQILSKGLCFENCHTGSDSLRCFEAAVKFGEGERKK